MTGVPRLGPGLRRGTAFHVGRDKPMPLDPSPWTPAPPPPATGFSPWRVAEPAFTSWSADALLAAGRTPEAEPEPAVDVAAAVAAAYAEGLIAGRATIEAELAPERDALARLAESLKVMRPDPSAPLALLLVEAVDHMVRQVVGEVEVDATSLLARAQAAAELIVEQTRPSTLRLHPEDFARLAGAVLPVAMVADAAVARGDVVLETAEGWIEDGIPARLDAVRTALAAMGA